MSIIKHNLEFVFFIHTKFTYTDTETDVMSNQNKTMPAGGIFLFCYTSRIVQSVSVIVRQNIINVLYVFRKIKDFPKD